MNDNISSEIMDAVELYVKIMLSKASFVQTDIAKIVGVGTSEGNKINIKGLADYDNIKSIGDVIYPNNSIVFVLYPNGQPSQSFILGQLFASPSNINGGSIDIGNGKFTVDNNGNIKSTSGVIGGWNIDENSLYCSTLGSYRFPGGLTFNGNFVTKLKKINDSDVNYVMSIVFTPTDEPDLVTTPFWLKGNGDCFINYLSSEYVGAMSMSVEEQLTISSLGSFLCNGVATFKSNVYNSSGGVVFVSDENKKHDISTLDLEKSANFIYSQDPVEYKFNEGTSNRLHHGLIAQRVKETMGEEDWGVYIDTSIKDDTESFTKGLRYDEFIADLIATCQYQKTQIDKQQEEINLLKQEINNIKEKIEGDENNGNDNSDSTDS